MQITHTVPEIRQALRASRSSGPVVLVPTMGALHEGHASLIREARRQAGEKGTVVATLFVNPTQFGPKEDFAVYPRTPDEDARIASANGTDLLFSPEVAAMYAPDASTRVNEEKVSLPLCGASRPGHFSGVCTVVSKLFNLVQPDIAIFGKKDRQQLAVIRRMVRDLDIPVEILGADTVREDDGLAMSSRNRRLDPVSRAQAPAIRKGLLAAADALAGGETDAASLLALAREPIASSSMARIDYLEIVDEETLIPLPIINRPAFLAAAVFFGHVRLIDNIDLVPPGGPPAA
ncbi:MAG: pantoate--beta-alanine ligase [Verrucomicrobiales bacterium]